MVEFPPTNSFFSKRPGLVIAKLPESDYQDSKTLVLLFSFDTLPIMGLRNNADLGKGVPGSM
jgi:hypothetical protein